MNGLDHFETLAEQLIEGTFERLFRPRLHPSEVARRLARSMEDGRVIADNEPVLLPNRYWVFLNPDDLVSLDSGGETLQAELLRYLRRLAIQVGGQFSGPLQVSTLAIVDLASGELAVRTAHTTGQEDIGRDTQAVPVAAQSTAEVEHWNLRWGGRNYPLGEPVVRLGRALNNDVIIDDRRVSRRHAELRWRAGRYQLSDMGSSGGTALNGQPVRQGEEFPLACGDVINLAGIILTVHSEGDPIVHEEHSTSTMPPDGI